MYKFKNSVVALIGLVTLIVVTTALMPHIGYGSSGPSPNAPSSQTQNVKVVNTGTESVPIQGTATVNGTVQAQQNGIWNVGINGTPVVGLDAGNNTVKFDAVNNTVKIDPVTPVPVRDVDNPARQPFQTAAYAMPISDGTNGGTAVLVVPTGKRLVIEFVSVATALPQGEQLQGVVVTTTQGNDLVSHTFGGTLQANLGGVKDIFVTSQQTRLYSDGGATVVVTVSRNNFTGTGNFQASISGYLVDMP